MYLTFVIFFYFCFTTQSSSSIITSVYSPSIFLSHANKQILNRHNKVSKITAFKNLPGGGGVISDPWTIGYV